MRSKKKNNIENISDHQKLINLLAINGEEDINRFLQSIDKVFTEIFHVKQSELPWYNNNSSDEWDSFMRKSRLAFCLTYYQLIKKDRTYH